MQNAEPMQLQQFRDFGQIISGSFRFLRENWRPIFRALAIICLPLGMIAGFFMGRSMTDMQRASTTINGTTVTYNNPLENSLPMIFGYILMALVIVMMVSIIYEYMRAYNAGEHHGITTADLWDRSIKQFGNYLGMSFFYYLLVIIGSLMCILPGIYAMVTFALIYPVHALERRGAIGSFTRAFHLIKERWWETFGLFIVVSMIQGVLMYAFLIPLMIISAIVGLNSVGTMGAEDPTATLTFASIFMAIMMTIYVVMIILIYPIMAVACGLKYFSLVEEKEGVSIRQKIQGFEQA